MDLWLYNPDGTEFTNWQYASGSREWDETIDLPSSGTVLIMVNPRTGASRYKLTIGQRVVPSSSSQNNYKFEHTFIPGQLIKTKRFYSNNIDEDIEKFREEKINLEVDARPKNTELKSDTLIEFDLDRARQIQNITDIDTKDERLIISEKQKEYVYHWRLIQKLESKYPEIDFGFNYPIYPSANFSKDP